VNPAPETFATTRLTARRVGVGDQPFLVGVMEKLGLRYDAEVEHAGFPHVLYGMNRNDWEQRAHG